MPRHRAMPLITAEVAGFLEGPNTVWIATQDGALVPDCTHGLALRCAPDGDHVTVWTPAVTAARAAANLRVDDRIAVVSSFSATHRTLQVKGRALSVALASDERRALLDTWYESFAQGSERVGLPRRFLDRVVRWPALEIHVRVSALFDQTPGPGAGERFVSAPCP